jgi:hypothetical protein
MGLLLAIVIIGVPTAVAIADMIRENKTTTTTTTTTPGH